ncbi:MAG: helix-turn-helix domain-containing protein [Desulfobacteraceae bacterium]|nr:MAG: helix-turn-helix domain-containing protein [Desulfobacteraceae bacterium]
MIEPEKRKAIFYLYSQGMAIKQIARSLQVDKKTVHTIILQKGELPNTQRADTIVIAPELLNRLYGECDGYVQRIHEKLTEEHHLKIGYSTLTEKIRELELGKPVNQRCEEGKELPGAEMQHDTSGYKLRLGIKPVKLIGSLIYFRYSKVRYLKFYRYFNRFIMKCFFHEALVHWGYSAPVCIIDNTNLARLSGTGSNAVIVPEMLEFAKSYGFEFVCHEKGHANRKAGNERGFFTTTTNFFPGREFNDLQDLNRQALYWATVKSFNRPVGKSGLIPAQAFEYEQAYLKKLPPIVSPPYLEHQRGIDQYGYISFDGNFYWVPGLKRHEVKVLQYPDRIRIYHQREMLIEYPLASFEVKNQKFFPPDRPHPRHEPKDRKNPTDNEEKILRGFSGSLDAYLNFALKAVKQKHNFIRQLYRLSQKMSAGLFEKAVARALSYRITDPDTIYRIAVLQMKEDNYQAPRAYIDAEFINRPAFQEGRFTDDVDLSIYTHIGEDENGSGTDEDA